MSNTERDPTPEPTIGPPPDGLDAAPHFYTRRPVHLCTDDRDDDDDGPPRWRTLDDIDWLSGTGRWGQ